MDESNALQAFRRGRMIDAKSFANHTVLEDACFAIRMGRHHLVICKSKRESERFGIELAMAARVAVRLRAPLWVVTPQGSSDPVLSRLRFKNIKIRLLSGWTASFLDLLFSADLSRRLGSNYLDWTLLLINLFREQFINRRTLAPRLQGNASGPPDRVEREQRETTYYKRIWLDQSPCPRFDDKTTSEIAAAMRVIGVDPNDKIALFHLSEKGQIDGRLAPAIAHLRKLQYKLVGVGANNSGAELGPQFVQWEKCSSPRELVEAYFVSRGQFLIDERPAYFRNLAVLFRTPTLTLDVVDPLTCFPVREHDLFILKRVRDRGTSRWLTPVEMLSDAYLDNAGLDNQLELRGREFHASDSDDILDAVCDMVASVSGPPLPELAAQRHFRLLATGAAVRRSGANSSVSEAVQHNGYLGRGRVAPSFARRYISFDHDKDV